MYLALLILALTSHATHYTILHTTDIHGWVNGHAHEDELDTDAGDVASLAIHMAAKAHHESEEFLFFDTGDLIEGTGFSDASSIHGEYVFPVISQMGSLYDGLTIGNHDIGHEDTLALMKKSFIPGFKGRYVTSNTRWADEDNPMGSNYYVLETPQGHRVLVLGFLYNFTQPAPSAKVLAPIDATKEDWFKQAMEVKNVDLIVAACHIDPWEPPDLKDVFKAVRSYHSKKPFVLLSGHRHVKYFDQFDDNAFTLESGRYLECVGVADFDIVDGAMDNLKYQWPAASLDNFYELSDTPAHEFNTDLGSAIRTYMASISKKLDLDKVVGCSPKTWDPYAALSKSDSFYSLLLNSIIPTTVFDPNAENEQYYVTNSAFLRFKMFKGDVSKNDVFTVSPFNDTFYGIFGMEGSELAALKKKVSLPAPAKQYRRTDMCPLVPPMGYDSLSYWLWLEKEIDESATYDLLVAEYDGHNMMHALGDLYPDKKFDFGPYPTGLSSTMMLAAYVEKTWPCK